MSSISCHCSGRPNCQRLTAPMVEAFADASVKTLSWQRAGKVLSA